MRYVTSNTTTLPWPAKISNGITPHAATHTHCWAKLRCKGAELPPERQPGGICAACTAPQKAKSEIAAARFTNGKPVSTDQFKPDASWANGIKPLACTAKATKHERSMDRWRDPEQPKFKPAIDDDKVPMTSGTLRRLGDTVHVPMRWGNRMVVRAAYLVQCDRDLGGCGREPFYASRSKLARTNFRLSACEHCLPAVKRKNVAKQKAALKERRKAERAEVRSAA